MRIQDMVVVYSKTILFFSGLLFFGCSSDLSPKDILEFGEDQKNSFRKEKTIEPFMFVTQYKPVDYIIAMESQGADIESEFYQTRRKELGDEMHYFNFHIKPTDNSTSPLKYIVKSETEYNKIINYLAFEMQDDIYLLDGLDTLKCQLFHFTRNYDVTPNLDFVLGFEKRKKKDFVFVYDDQIFNTGTIKLKYSDNTLSQFPKLKIN